MTREEKGGWHFEAGEVLGIDVGRHPPWLSQVSECLARRGTDGLCPGLPFKSYPYSKQPWKFERVFPCRIKGRLICCPV